MLQLALLKAKKKNDDRLQKRLFSDEKSIAVWQKLAKGFYSA
jgi:hypothetical protein